MLRRGGFLLFTALVLGATAPASAAPITVSFAGVVTTLTDDAGLLDGSIGLGTPFSGSWSYDPVLLSDDDPDPDFGSYWVDPATFSLAITIGSYSISYDPLLSVGAVTTQNDAAIAFQDQFTVAVDGVVGLESLPATIASSFVQVFLTDSTQTSLSGDALVGVPYTDAAWDARIVQVGAELELEPGVFTELFVEGTLNILPEPASVLLLAPLVLLASGRRR